MVKIIILLCVLISQVLSFSEERSYAIRREFETFKKTFNKNYNREEENERYKIFKNNYNKIKRHNEKFKKELISWDMGIGPFADLTESDFMNLFRNGCGVPYLKSRENVGITEFKINARKSPPHSVDHEENLGPPKDQLNCNAGWAFAAVSTIEGMLSIMNRPTVSLSEQNLIDCAYGHEYGSYGCSGGSIWGAFLYLQTRGISSSKTYPYEGKTNRCRAIYNNPYNVGHIYKVGATEQNLKVALSNGPVASEVEVTPILMHYKKGFLKDCGCRGVTNHAVTIIGYGEACKGPFWKLRNSWGPHWGENGNYRVLIGDEHECDIGKNAYFIPSVSGAEPSCCT